MKFSLFLCCGAEIIIDYILHKRPSMNEKTVKKHQSRTSAAKAESEVHRDKDDGNKFPFFPFLASLTLVTPRTEALGILTEVPFDSIKPRPRPRLHPHNCFNAAMTRL